MGRYTSQEIFFYDGTRVKIRDRLIHEIETTIMFTQISAKVGIKKFGEKAMEDMVKEYRKT